MLRARHVHTAMYVAYTGLAINRHRLAIYKRNACAERSIVPFRRRAMMRIHWTVSAIRKFKLRGPTRQCDALFCNSFTLSGMLYVMHASL